MLSEPYDNVHPREARKATIDNREGRCQHPQSQGEDIINRAVELIDAGTRKRQ
jgi:hypothetical protein